MDNFYCAAPWRGVHINPRGDVKTCCAGDPNMLGNLNEHSIEQILHGPVMQEIRQSIRGGQPHAYCYNCVQAERYGRSERDWHNTVSPEFDPRTAGDTEHVPVLIDVRWNITCNLSCNYCGDKCSSKWAALKHIPFKSGARPYYEQVCDYLQQHREHVREVALVGGEPLLLPENERLLDVIPEDCTVTLITNLSVDLENNKIFQKLSQRRRVGWSMSFENIESRFEYVRHGASWELLLKNLAKIKLLMANQDHWGGIHAVYNVYNATRLVEFTKFARDQGQTIQWQSLYQPECLDPARLGISTTELAHKEIEKLLATGICLENEQKFFEDVLISFEKTKYSNDSDLAKKFVEHIKEIEFRYHRDQQGNFWKLWPEFNLLFADVVLKKTPNLQNKLETIRMPDQQNLSNQTLQWLGEDSIENFEKNLENSKIKEKLKQAGWLTNGIDYRFNSKGFRSVEFDTAQEHFCVFGCSFTLGVGIQQHQRYGDIVSNETGLQCFNFGWGGGNDSASFRLAYTWLPQLKPKFVIYQSTFPERFEIISNDTYAIFHGINAALGGHKQADLGDMHKHWLANPMNSELLRIKNHLAIQHLCHLLHIPLIEIDHDMFLKFCDVSARDLHHPGPLANQGIAEIILEKLS